MTLKGSNVVFSGTFTGYTRKTAEERATKAGCNVRKAVSKKTNILICGDEPGGKLDEAERLGITILDQDEWEAELKKGGGAASDDEDEEEDETEEEDTASEMTLKGSNVVFSGTFTGYTRKTAEERATKAGCNVRKAVSKKTNILICGDEPGGKLDEAERLGITILDQDEWEAELKKGGGAASDDDDEEEDEEEEDMESDDNGAAGAPDSTTIKDLREKKVVFTGTFTGYTRRMAEDRAMKAGCLVTKAVSSKTNILIAGDGPGSKVTEANRLGVTVMNQRGWESLLKKCSKADEEEDMDSEASGDAPAAKPTKPKLKRARTHNMSDDEDQVEAPAKPKLVKRRSLRLDEKQDSATTKAPPAKKARMEPAPVAGSSRPKCRYWEKCYRKEPTHIKNFRHPPEGGANADVDDDEEEDMDEGEMSAKPLNVLADGETAEVEGGLHGASKYTVKRVGDHYTCTCTAWKLQRTGVDTRTCRHLRAYLGDEFENERTKFDPEVKPVPSRSLKHKSVAVLLAHKWTEGVDPKGWWLSEKLDGVRAYWDGKCFYSRLGNEFLPPKWFIKGLPTDVCLDGELFGGRGKFQSTVSIVKTAESSRWKDVKYCVFDAPSLKKETFEKRVKAINDIFENDDIPYAYALEHEKCRGKDHMFEELERVEKLGGEGVMIREPGSKYVGSRSKTLLKLKSFHDAEAVVTGFEKGKGRNASVVGALVCRMACGTVFKVGSGLSDKDRRSPPKKGSIITYRFQELTNGGHPRFPTFVGVRIDLDEPCDAVLPPKPTDD